MNLNEPHYKLQSINYKRHLSLRAKVNHLKKIRVAAVNYLNTKPLLYGIKKSAFINSIELIEEYPSHVAQMLLDGTADVGLIPVAVIPQLKESHIITDYCIGCDGAVASVCIFSDVPMHEITSVYLDYQSRTSVQLAKILLKNHWKSNAQIIEAKGEEYRREIKGSTGGLVIGDRALEQRLQSRYVYDLGEAWKAHTGLPFVFAAWVSSKELPADFIKTFSKANGLGFKYLDEVITDNKCSVYNLKEYYTINIRYKLDEHKFTGLEKFLHYLSQPLAY